MLPTEVIPPNIPDSHSVPYLTQLLAPTSAAMQLMLLGVLSLTSLASAQYLAGQTVSVATYHNQLLLEGSGSYQRILYEDAVNSTTVTNMIWSDVMVAPCGAILPSTLYSR